MDYLRVHIMQLRLEWESAGWLALCSWPLSSPALIGRSTVVKRGSSAAWSYWHENYQGYECHQSVTIDSERPLGIPTSASSCLASDSGAVTPVLPRAEIPSAAPPSERVATGIIQMLPRAGPGDPRADAERGPRTFRASVTLPTRYRCSHHLSVMRNF